MISLPPDNLSASQRTLTVQLAAMMVLSLGVGLAFGAWDWGVAAGAGFLAAIIYFVLLGMQVRRTLASGRQLNVAAIIVSLLGRQVICFLAPLLCFYYLGQAWWACVITLLIARHWVMLVGNSGVPTPRQA